MLDYLEMIDLEIVNVGEQVYLELQRRYGICARLLEVLVKFMFIRIDHLGVFNDVRGGGIFLSGLQI